MASQRLPPVLESRRPKQCPEKDYSTLSNYSSFKVHHSSLDLKISFEQKTISGKVLYDISCVGTENTILLDTSFLNIAQVAIDDKPVDFKLQPRKEPLGARLDINVAETLPSRFHLMCEFSTTKECTALQWLDEHQTSGKPYVFSQLEAIHARSLFPCFDTPSVKSIFSANITSTLPVVFSGILESTTSSTYHFKQNIPIPAYLIGIASGDLQSAEVLSLIHI